jgi:sugar phosphate isomerase/epimerase
VRINYDTGNSASLGFSFDEEKKYYDLIKNVHIKDRKFKGKTVRLGLGNAKLKKIINFFKKKKYKGNFILQTARNKQNFHIHEINLNRSYILQL